MRRARPALMVVGLVLAAFGALFLLQGAGVVRWPAESFMIGARVWIGYGAALALVGLGLAIGAGRMR